MVSSETITTTKMDPEGHEPSGKSRHDNDPAIQSSSNKHLTRLVRFSILQARRSSQASKAQQQNSSKGTTPTSVDAKPSQLGSNSSALPSPPAGNNIMESPRSSPRHSSSSPRQQQQQQRSRSTAREPSTSKFPFTSLYGGKERPSTEVQYEYNDAPGRVGDGIDVVQVPTDPPIIEDLSASLTLSDGENGAYSGSLSEEGMHAHPHHHQDHMDLLLAPDSGSGDDHLHPSSSNEVYNSAEMYSSSGNYDGSHSSDELSTESSDSIMRRVEEEIANARKASNDAQARLAYFTQKQKELSPVMTDSYSFDFDENVDSSRDPMHSMLDVGESTEDYRPAFRPNGQKANPPEYHLSPGAYSRGSYHPNGDQTPTTQDENYNNAMGMIGKEFDAGSADVEEKVDIEVVLAPSSQKNLVPPPKPKFDAGRSPSHAFHRRSPRGNSKSPRHRADDSVDIDEAVINAVFSEKSIESLPVRESLPAVFSEQSMESLPTQPTQSSIAHSSIAPSSIGKPASYSYQEDALSPVSIKRHNMLPNKNRMSPRHRTPMESNMSIETDSNFVSKETVSPLATSTGSSKLPSTPREAPTPSYRERLENKLKILGSRYPVSPATKSTTTPTNKKDGSRFSSTSTAKRETSVSPSKSSKNGPDIRPPTTPKETTSAASISVPTSVTSPLGEAYDGLESRIKDLLARTLNPVPSEAPQSGEKEVAYQSSPSAELKAIKKLLEQGVAAAAAAEERKRELQERQEQDGLQATPASVVSESKATPVVEADAPTPPSRTLALSGQEVRVEDLNFPVLEDGVIPEVSEEQSEVSKSKSHETAGSVNDTDRLRMRPSGSFPRVKETPDETKNAEPSVTCSTSEEILEALDSFSQSTEFKSKSRKCASPKASLSPSPKPEGEDDSLNSKVKEVVVQSELESGNESNVAEQQPEVTPPNSRGGKFVASLKTYLENAYKPSEPQPEPVVQEPPAADEEECPTAESRAESDTDNFQTVADSGSLQESMPPDDHHDSQGGVKKVNSTNVEVHSHEEVCDSEYESCAEGIKEEERPADPVPIVATDAPKPETGKESPSTTFSEINSPAAAKKTPSVLNLALSRPAIADARERPRSSGSSNDKKSRQPSGASPSSSDDEEKPETDTDAAIVSSGSQTTYDDSDQPGNSTIAAESNDASSESEKLRDQPTKTHCEEQDAVDTDPAYEHVAPTTGDSRAPDIQIEPRPTDESDASKGNVPQNNVPQETMLDSLIDPSNNPEQPLTPTAPDGKETEPERQNTPPPAKVKSVTVVSPKSAAIDTDAKTPQAKNNDRDRQRVVGRGDRKIRFRDPYPTPKPCRKPRSTSEIQRDYSCKPTHKERNIRWKEPKGDLKRLLVAALDSSVSRRSNACGALKVISKLEKNKVVLVRTKGFLEALVFVATDEITSDEPEAKEDARARAISCIYNVSHVKDNRLIVCTHQGLLDCLVKTINEDRGEARMEACGILAQLAKSPQCRDIMVSVEELLSTLASVLKGTIDPEEKMLDNPLSEDVTEDIPSSYSEMSSVLSEEHIPFPKSPQRNGRKDQREQNKVRANCSIRKQKSEMYDQYFELARLSSCAALIHLSKQCSILDHFCSNMFLLESIVQVARDSKSPLHCKCLEMLCNVSRLPGNTATMTRFPGMVDTLIGGGSSKDAMDRIWALRTLQNMTSDASSKAPLATSTLLTLLINCVTSRNTDEQHAAMATLLNLSTDPSAVVPITSTKNVLATLVYLAHNADSTSEIRLMACNALATVGLWLQTVSGFGSIPEDTRRVLLPSHKTTGWDIWE